MEDQQADYAEYVAARWPALLRTASLLIGDHAEAEDLLQSVLVTVYVKWSRVSAADSIDAYVRKMLVNELLGRKRRTQRRTDRHHLIPIEPASLDDPADRLTLWSSLATLPRRQRAVLVLRYYEDLTEAQIAEALGCSRGTVKSQAHDALQKLRAQLGEQEAIS